MTELNYSKRQINPLVKKYSIDVENNKYFQSIITMFEDQTPYQIWAIKGVFENVFGIEDVQRIKSWVDENHTDIQNLVKKNIISYKTKTDISNLYKEMEGIKMIHLVKDVISRFNTQQRELLKNNIDIPDALEAKRSPVFNKYYEIFKGVLTLPKHRQEKLISTSSAIDSFGFLIEHVSKALEASYSWNKEDMLGFLSRNCPDSSVVYDNDNIVIVQVASFDSSRKLCGGGRTGWCLTREISYFRRYVNENNANQFFYFDFSKREDHELAHIGFTVRPSEGIVNAHSTKNSCMLGDGIIVEGKRVNIHNVLENNNVPKNVFIRLNKLTKYKWDMDAFIEWAGKNKRDMKVCIVDNKRVVLKINNNIGLENVLAHTLIDYNHISVNEKRKNFVILDFNLSNNEDKSIIELSFNKDVYGLDSLNYMVDAYNLNMKDSSYLNDINMSINKFLPREEIKSSILLHKLIDENNESDLVKLINETSDLDVNYILNNRTPIFSIIDKKMPNAFKAIINHKKFNASIQNAYGEVLLQSLLYDYNLESNSENDVYNIRKMINIIIDSDTFDFNSINLNDDSAINVAAEFPNLLWVVEKLVENPRVNVNVINDINCSALTNAIRRNNVQAIRVLGTRPDLIIRKEDKEMAKKMNINLSDFIKPKKFESFQSVEYFNEPKFSSSDFASLFEKVMSMAK